MDLESAIYFFIENPDSFRDLYVLYLFETVNSF